MDTLGNYLREEREKQGKTLDDIARTSRISRSTLEVIESGQDKLLPPASYLRGLLKLYARELGLSVEDVLARMPRHPAEKIRVALPRTVDLETPKRPWLKIGITTAIVCLAVLWIWQAFSDFTPSSSGPPEALVSPRPIQQHAHTDLPEQPAQDTDNRSSASGVGLPVTTPAAVPAPADEAPADEQARFEVKFVARGIVWMKLQADNGDTVDITLKKGESYRITAGKSLQVRLGNPALVDAWYNDAPVSLGGTPGLPLDATFPDIAQQKQQPGQ